MKNSFNYRLLNQPAGNLKRAVLEMSESNAGAISDLTPDGASC
ncbi:hypothetical protein [Pseudomonas sp. Marseille-QA0332]